ncbi:ATP-binding cassette domain-containing protein [Brevibacterium sp. FAM 27836]|uniref:ATP-binding cassette domain-containing protein n=1 Tax=Brevibacterium sp. FAM 27836 TaxID=3446693 RepID=UPI003F51484D
MSDYVIEAEGLVKRYGKHTALDGVDLRARPGTVLAVLGPNGAGKTTSIRILATLTGPDAGTARVGGMDVNRDAAKVRRIIGLTGQYAMVEVRELEPLRASHRSRVDGSAERGLDADRLGGVEGEFDALTVDVHADRGRR